MKKFIEYNQHQGLALPPYLEELIEERHLVRVVNDLVDQIDLELLAKGFQCSNFQNGGSPPYHPSMMMKVLIYSYATGIRSCRQIASQLKSSIHYMWLSGMQYPDFRTINRYRSKYFKDILEEVFVEFVLLLKKKKLIDFKTIFVDGTKLSADSNKYKITWKKNVSRYKENIKARTRVLFAEISNLNDEENKRYGEFDLPSCGEQNDLSSEDLHRAATSISEAISKDGKRSKTEVGKKLRKAAGQLKKDADKLKQYEQQEQVLGTRNSFSKTDLDATAMRMKNDELRPGYNVQVMTNKGFIVGSSVSQNANDGSSFIPLMEGMRSSELPVPREVVADAGYGHEEVYEYLESHDIESFIKYPGYYAEQTKERKYAFHYSRFTYNKEQDIFICPAQKKLLFHEVAQRTTKSGYVIDARVYKCSSCQECPHQSQCTQSKEGRNLIVSMKLREHQQKTREKLGSSYGNALIKRRGFEIETVFGDWKHNFKFRRFQLRGIAKVRAEIFLHCLAYNFRKIAKLIKKLFFTFFGYFCRYFLFIWAKNSNPVLVYIKCKQIRDMNNVENMCRLI